MYVPLDVNFPDDEKIIGIGLAGAGLYAMALCVAKRLETDGRLTRAHLRRLGGTDDLIDQLVLWELLTDDEDESVLWIAAWLDHNMSQVELDDRRATDAKRKRLNRRKRPAGHSEPSARTPKSVRPDAADASENVQPLEIETETETPEETLAPAPPARARDLLFEAVAEACRIDIGELTSTGRGPINKAVAELRAVGASPAGVRMRAQNYATHFDGAALTPMALAKHWSMCANPAAPTGKAARNHAALDRVVGAVDAALNERKAIGQ